MKAQGYVAGLTDKLGAWGFCECDDAWTGVDCSVKAWRHPIRVRFRFRTRRHTATRACSQIMLGPLQIMLGPAQSLQLVRTPLGHMCVGLYLQCPLLCQTSLM